MKTPIKLLFLFLALVLLPAPLLATTEYQLDLSLIPTEQQLIATAQIRFDTDRQPNEITLQLAENCEIAAVHQAGKELPYIFKQGKLKIALSEGEPKEAMNSC